MKRTVAVITALTVVSTVFCACSGVSIHADIKPKEENAGTRNTEPTELIVFAAASMTETMEQIRTTYEEANPGIKIMYNFDSSGTLKTQIEEGADCDMFISAAPKQMNELDNIDEDTRIDLLENKVVLAVPEQNPKNINSYNDLVSALNEKNVMLAIGNEDVPVGQYTQKIFEYFGLDEKTLADEGLITYGSNVKEVTTQVSEAVADCGIIYSTDAYSAQLEAVDTATADMCGQVIYPAAVLNTAKHPDEAKAFLDYLTGDESKKVFESVGFTCLN